MDYGNGVIRAYYCSRMAASDGLASHNIEVERKVSFLSCRASFSFQVNGWMQNEYPLFPRTWRDMVGDRLEL